MRERLRPIPLLSTLAELEQWYLRCARARFQLLRDEALPSRPPLEEPADRLHILVVDRAPACMELVCGLLEWMGHACQTVAPADAPACVHDVDVDLVLLDVGYPETCGFEVARRIRAAARSQPYLVAVSGWSHSEHRRRALDAGFDAHVLKPLTLAVLERLVAVPRRSDLGAPELAIVR